MFQDLNRVRPLPTAMTSSFKWTLIHFGGKVAGKHLLVSVYSSSWATKKKSEVRFNGETTPLMSVGV